MVLIAHLIYDMRSSCLGTEQICCVLPPLWKLYFWDLHLLMPCPNIIIREKLYSMPCFIYTLRVTVGKRSVFVVCWWTHHRSSPLAWFGTQTTLIWLRMWFTVWELALNWEMWVFCILALTYKDSLFHDSLQYQIEKNTKSPPLPFWYP